MYVQLDIQAAEDVIAVAFARVALLNISTGIYVKKEIKYKHNYITDGTRLRTAQLSGPIPEEKTRLN